MKAILSRTPGGPETLQLGDMPIPEPSAGEVLLDGSNVALPVNPSDDDLISTGWLIVYDEFGQRENGVTVSVRESSTPTLATWLRGTWLP